MKARQLSLGLLAAAVVAAMVMPASAAMISYYPCDTIESNGVTVLDAVGSRDMSIVLDGGPSMGTTASTNNYMGGDYGNALQILPGHSWGGAWMGTWNPSDLDNDGTANSYSVMMWVNTPSLTPNTGPGPRLITKGQWATVNPQWYLDNGKAKIEAYPLGGATGVNTSTPVISVDTWHHVAYTWQHTGTVAGGDIGDLNEYVDGVLVASGTMQLNDLSGSSNPAEITMMLGNMYQKNQVTDNIIYDEIKFFDTALTQAEVAAEMAMPGSTTLAGDLNSDGVVSSGDLDIVRAYWGQSVPAGVLEQGDANNDGLVNSADLDIIRANWGNTAPAAVPEPTISLMILGGLLYVFGRRAASRS